MFLDRVKINIKAGNGGNGSSSFLRNAQTMKGGPDGGEGGKGGDIIFVANKNMNTLYNFKLKKKFYAEDGGKGAQKLKTGANGRNLEISVPVGCVLIDAQTNKIIADLCQDGMRFVALRGGNGGHGNAYYKSSVKQSPAYSQTGELTKAREVILELKTIADVGLVGFPNVGKSTLLSCISNANPKIANYPFTTLYPNLGVCEVKGETFVVADIPGLIEGASQGQGLGHYFLKHVERVRLIVHLLDVSESEGRDFIDDYHKINNELYCYSQSIGQTPQIIVFSKIDLLSESELEKKRERFIKEIGLDHIEISGATTKGIEKLKIEILSRLKEIPKKPAILIEEENFDKKEENTFNISREDDGTFVVYGGKIDNFIRGVVLSDEISFAYFQKTLKEMGVIEALINKGMRSGDSVRIKDITFEYVE